MRSPPLDLAVYTRKGIGESLGVRSGLRNNVPQVP